MRIKPFSQHIKQLRTALGITQAELALRAGLKLSRASDLELGRRLPTSQERALLARALHREPGDLADELTRHDLPTRAHQVHRKFCRKPPQLKQSRSRPTWIRLLHARRHHPELYRILTDGIKQREDYPAIVRFLHDAVADSRYEVLLWLQCLTDLFFPDRISPLRCNFRSLPISEDGTLGDLRFPALVRLDPFPVVLFPQMPVLAGGESWRLDLLIGARRGKRTLWVNGEIDGAAHEASRDERRTRLIALPRLKLSPEDVLARDCVGRLVARLKEL